MRVAIAITAAAIAVTVGLSAQRAGAFGESRDHPAIRYSDAPLANVVSELTEKLRTGHVQLTFEPGSGYLRSLLAALDVPVESQLLVFSQTSFQARKISKQNPRAVYFNDRVAVGFVRGGEIVEIAAQDRRQGTVFYQLPQTPSSLEFARNEKCLSCHLSWETRAVPGPLVLSVLPRRTEDDYANGGHVDHGTPIAERWGGWFVTGEKVPAHQMGNLELLQPDMPDAGPRPVAAKTSLDGVLDLSAYPAPYSDVVALMVLEHQAHATNLITRAGWEYRVAAPAGEALPPRVREAVDELVDYFLFVDEAPLPSPIRGSSGFAQKFSAQGPRDRKGRSLRELQLDTRLMRYSCSYMIYSPGFEGLPPAVQEAVFERISTVLSGHDRSPKYAHLTPADRAATREILRDTLPVSVRHFL